MFVNNGLRQELPDLTICVEPDSTAWGSEKQYKLPDGVFGRALCQVLTQLIEKGVATRVR